MVQDRKLEKPEQQRHVGIEPASRGKSAPFSRADSGRTRTTTFTVSSLLSRE
jgi:hypothetical protein